MPEGKKESLPYWLLHKFDRMMAPKEPAKRKLQSHAGEKGWGAANADGSMKDPRPAVQLDPEDDIGVQVEALRRKRKIFSLGTSHEPD